MAFNFGSGSTPAPGPAPAGGGFSFAGGAAPTPSFSFGSTPVPAPQSGTPAAPAAVATATGGFSFGGAAPAPAATATGAAPTPAAGGFSFGNAPAPATAGATPASGAPAPAAGGFSFGNTPGPATAGATPAPGAPAPAAGGFSFGNTPAPAATAAAPTPAVGGFSFGNAPAPATAGATPAPGAPAPAAGGFSFGNAPAPATAGATPAPGAPAPAAGGLSFGGAGATAAPPVATPATVSTQDFDSVFPNLQLWQQIQKWSRTRGSQSDENDEQFLGKQELEHCITSNQSKLQPKTAEWTPPNNGLRQQLSTNPTISIAYPSAAGSPTETTRLTSKNLERILRLATDLRISEAHAVSLYAQVSQHLEAIGSLGIPNSMESVGMETKKYGEVSLLARNFFFYQQGLQLQTLLFLLQSRIQNSSSILEATDGLLQKGLVINLVKVIREYTQRIQELQHETGASKNPYEVSMQQLTQNLQHQQLHGVATNSGKKPSPTLASVHLLFCQQQRQIAAECLFFIAYHTQMTPTEMAGLLDLIKELSGMLPVLSPFSNVPSPYKAAGGATSGNTWNSSAPFTYALKEKDPLEWQRELVECTCGTGQTQVLQCSGLLVVAAIAAMEGCQVLHDRDRHGPNSFGKGNQFLPPSENPSVPQELQSRLGPDGSNAWARKDIWGLLAAAYALMLRSAPTALMSPRAGSSIQTNQIRNTARECLVLPSTYKSFTFCRLTMIPALQKLSLSAFANLSEFGLSVLSECISNYLDVLSEGSMPMSRKKYEKEEQEELDLRRAQAAEVSRFNQWSGKINAKQEEIPTSVDLMARPDCLDDIIAVASSLCQLGSGYSQNFWNTDANGKLVPSQLLTRLDQLQSVDDSLMPLYLSFMAALANDKASADAIYNFLARPTEALADGSSNPQRINWVSLIYHLRWYAQQLISYDNSVSKSTSATSSSSSHNTAYYYNLEGNSIPSGLSDSISTTSQTKTSTTSRSGKPKELSVSANFRVASHLAVIQKVAKYSSAAKQAILSITLRVGDDVAAGGDDSLLVLFKLAIAPLAPIIRGATLSTIANLLELSPGYTAEERAFAQQQGNNAWEYLESCPLLPIALLDQHYNKQAADERARASLGFPPSSITLSNSTPDKKGMLKKDPTFGIIYEMEQVESRMGWYPSTEGFLQLLKSLIISAGCPRNLGQSWRPRTGCAPYIEYILDFVLTRAVGIKGAPILPFRVRSDQSRLLTKALEVLDVVVSRYAVPSAAIKGKKDSADPMNKIYSKAVQLLGIEAVADKVVSQDAIAGTQSQEPSEDFTNRSSANLVENGGTLAAAKSSLPPTKSPGFIVLADILASGGGTVFETLALILSGFGGARGVQTVHRQQSDQIALTYALFGATPPNVDSAKEGAKEGGPTKLLQTFLKPLSPLMDGTQFDDAAVWREKSIILALQLLCATATREEDFISAVRVAKEPLKIVPLLQFQQIRYGSSGFRVIDVRLSPLTNLLLSIEGCQQVRASIIDCVGYTGCSEEQDMNMGSSALSLLTYLLHSVAAKGGLGPLVGAGQISTLSRAVAKRLLNCAKRPGSVVDIQTTKLIFDWILRDLRNGMPGELVQTLLGLPTYTKGGNWQPGTNQYIGSPTDCFDSILELLKDIGYATAPETGSTASKCFEVLFRLYDLFQGAGNNPLCLKTVLYTAERLRSINFWTNSLLTWLSDRGVMPLKQSISQIDATNLHSIAWLLKGLAIELKLLVGFADADILASELASYLSPRPTECKAYLSLLFGYDEKLITRLIQDIPLEKLALDLSLTPPPPEELRKATYDLPGPFDVVNGYKLLNTESVAKAIASKHTEQEVESMIHWVTRWNAAASWDCGASHITNATYFALSAALDSCQSLGTNVGQIIGLQATSQINLLAMILSRLCVNESNSQGMDASLIPMASKNLSNAALVLIDSITAFDQCIAPTSSELLAVASLLSRTLAHSNFGDESGMEIPIREERSTVLATSLSAILRHTSKSEPDFVRQYEGDFLAAASAITTFCLYPVDLSSNDLSPVAMLARSAFGAIMDACSDDGAEQMSDSLVFHALPTSFLSSLMNLVATMDESICKLLQTIALQPFGSEILINAGICKALQTAAKTYLNEESRVSSKLQSSSYNKVSLVTPRFLMSHLKLLSTLMSSETLPERKALELSIQATQTLVLYKMTIRRLCFNFPVEADVLRWFMRGFIQASSLSQSVDRTLQHSMLAEHSSELKMILAESGLVDNGIGMLCQQLWENPLPRDLLLQIPTELRKGLPGSPKSNVVNVETEPERSWWDVLDGILVAKGRTTSQFTFDAPVGGSDFWGGKRSKKWNEDKFEYAVVAMDILSLGCSLLKRLNRLDSINATSLACGLYHCTFTSQTLGSRLEEVQGLSSNSTSLMDLGEDRNAQLECEYLKLLGKTVSRSVEELIVLCHLLIGEVKENNEAAQSFSLVIDQIGIQTKGLGILESSQDGQSRLALVNELCDEIKKCDKKGRQ